MSDWVQKFEDEVIATSIIEIDDALGTKYPTGWHELSMGWFIAKGMSISQAADLADKVVERMNTLGGVL